MNSVRYHQMLVSPHLGGGEKVALELHNHVVTRCGPSSSHLWVPLGGVAEQMVREKGYPYTPYNVDRLDSSGPVGTGLEGLRLFFHAFPYRGGIVHVHSPFVYGAARSFLRAARMKTVLHIHLDFTADNLRWALSSPPDRIVVCAQFMEKAVEQALQGIPRPPRISVIRNAIDTTRFFATDRSVAKARIGVAASEPLLMVVANLAPHKGQETAVRAVARLKERAVFVKLWIVGTERSDGRGFLVRLQSLCARLGVEDRVYFAGFRQDVPELLQAADFLLLPSTSEGLPLCILEAQASRAVVLAAPTAGIPEVVTDRITGFLIAANDDAGYAERLAALISNRVMTESIADVAAQLVKDRHNMPLYGDRILAEYDELLAAEEPA